MPRIFIALVGFLAIHFVAISPAQAQVSAQPPPAPSDFDATAPAPPGLPSRLDIPPNTRIEVSAWRKNPIAPKLPLNPNNPRLLWDPDLESAVIESNDRDVHAVLHWEGGRQSEAFLIRGLCFRTISLAYPDTVAITGNALDFYVNRQNPNEGGNGNFPVISSYSPANFAGTASSDGKTVLVFASGGRKPGLKNYPDGDAVCLDPKTLLPVRIENSVFVFVFVYSPADNVQIDPQGTFLKAIQNQFGHWP